MKIIISPAKKMNVDADSFPCRDLPQLLPYTQILLRELQCMSRQELKQLWKCNDKILELNMDRLQNMDLYAAKTPAILAYEGIQYRYMAPGVFSERALLYIQDHLRIVSGFYGILRPFDGVCPYRLEMQAKLKVNGFGDLYAFWDNKIADLLFSETKCVINLASKEYSSCISRYLPETVRFITCTFAEEKGGKLIEKGTLCKMARGEMVRFLAENGIEDPEKIKDFQGLNYRYAPRLSSSSNFIFLRDATDS